MRLKRFLALSTLALAGSLTLAGTTRASFVPVLTAPAPGGSANVFTYSLNFSTNASTESLVSGDTLTLYDFDAGITSPASIVISGPAGLTATVQTVGFTPPALNGLPSLTDSGTINNITFTYTGATLNADTVFTATITTTGGPYTTRSGQFTSTDQINNPTGGPAIGKNNQIANVFLPTPVPEPTSVALMGLGLVGALGFYRRNKTSV